MSDTELEQQEPLAVTAEDLAYCEEEAARWILQKEPQSQPSLAEFIERENYPAMIVYLHSELEKIQNNPLALTSENPIFASKIEDTIQWAEREYLHMTGLRVLFRSALLTDMDFSPRFQDIVKAISEIRQIFLPKEVEKIVAFVLKVTEPDEEDTHEYRPQKVVYKISDELYSLQQRVNAATHNTMVGELLGHREEPRFIEEKIKTADLPPVNQDLQIVVQTIAYNEISSLPGQVETAGRILLLLDSISTAVEQMEKEGISPSAVEWQVNVNNDSQNMPIGNRRTLEFLRAVTDLSKPIDALLSELDWIPDATSPLGSQLHKIAKRARACVQKGMQICILDCTDGVYCGHNEDSEIKDFFPIRNRGSHRRALALLTEHRVNAAIQKEKSDKIWVIPVDADALIEPSAFLRLSKQPRNATVLVAPPQLIPYPKLLTSELSEISTQDFENLCSFLGSKEVQTAISLIIPEALSQIANLIKQKFPSFTSELNLTAGFIEEALGRPPLPANLITDLILALKITKNLSDENARSETLYFTRSGLWGMLTDVETNSTGRKSVNAVSINGSYAYRLCAYREIMGWNSAKDVGEDTDLWYQITYHAKATNNPFALPMIRVTPISCHGNLRERQNSLSSTSKETFDLVQATCQTVLEDLNDYAGGLKRIRLRREEVDLLIRSIEGVDRNDPLRNEKIVWMIAASLELDVIRRERRYPNLVRFFKKKSYSTRLARQYNRQYE